MVDVKLVSVDPTPLEYCPCCCKMLYVNDADKGLAPVVWRKTEHCLKQTWLWGSRERRGKYAGKGKQSRRRSRLADRLRGRWSNTLHGWYGEETE